MSSGALRSEVLDSCELKCMRRTEHSLIKASRPQLSDTHTIGGGWGWPAHPETHTIEGGVGGSLLTLGP